MEHKETRRRGYIELIIFLLACLVSAVALGDTHRWIGAADPVAQEDTITVANTWATDDTATVTCNKKTVTVTVGTDSATTDVAQIIAAAINATSATQGLINDEERNRGGQEIPEFTEMTATAESNVVTVKGATPGVPFTITVSESTAGTGTLTLATGGSGASVACEGPNFFDNADNWVNDAGANVLPATDDTIRFDSGSVDCLFNLDYSGTAIDMNLIVEVGYKGNIGLMAVNPLGYTEYRTSRFLVLDSDGTGNPSHEINAAGPGAVVGRRYIDCGATAPLASMTIFVHAGPADTSDGEAIQIVGGDEMFVNVISGRVALATHAQENATSLEAVRLGYANQQASDAYVRIGSNASWDNVSVFNGNLVLNGGKCDIDADCDGSSNRINVYNGRLVTSQNASLYGVNLYRGGYLDGRNTDINTLAIFDGGTCDFSRANDAASSITDNIELYPGATYMDPKGITISETLDLNGCGVDDVTLLLRDNVRLALTGL